MPWGLNALVFANTGQFPVFQRVRDMPSRRGLKVPSILVSAMAQFSKAAKEQTAVNLAAIKPDDPEIQRHVLAKNISDDAFLVENLGGNLWWKGEPRAHALTTSSLITQQRHCASARVTSLSGRMAM